MGTHRLLGMEGLGDPGPSLGGHEPFRGTAGAQGPSLQATAGGRHEDQGLWNRATLTVGVPVCQPLPCCRGRARGACPSPAFCSLWEGLGAHPRWWLLSGCSAGWLGNSGRLVGAARRPPHWAVPEASTRGRGCTSQGLGLSRVEEPAWAPGPAWVKDRPRLTSKTQPLEQSQPGSQSGRSVALARSPNGPVPQSPPPLVLGLSSVQDGSYCPVFQTGKLRLRTLTGCRKVTPLVQQAVGSEPGLLGPQRPLENLGGRGRGPWGRGGGVPPCTAQAASPGTCSFKVTASSGPCATPARCTHLNPHVSSTALPSPSIGGRALVCLQPALTRPAVGVRLPGVSESCRGSERAARVPFGAPPSFRRQQPGPLGAREGSVEAFSMPDFPDPSLYPWARMV